LCLDQQAAAYKSLLRCSVQEGHTPTNATFIHYQQQHTTSAAFSTNYCFINVMPCCPADTNFDYPGSCGRCYEVRCKSGLVEDRGAPVSIEQFYYLAKVNSNVQDTYGRSFPGEQQLSAVKLLW
jgi:hypothetical protein